MFRRVRGRVVPIRIKHDRPSTASTVARGAFYAGAAAVGGYLGARRALATGVKAAIKVADAVADTAKAAPKSFDHDPKLSSAYAYVRRHGGIFIKQGKDGMSRIRRFKGKK